MADINEIAKFIKESVDELVEDEQGCATFKLDKRLAVCVGWSAGYGEEKRDDVIQSKEEPDFAIVAGIKVWTSDDMRTDFDWINFPYYESGDVVDTSMSITPNENYEALAKSLLDSYDELKGLEIEKDGKIVDEPETEPELTQDDNEAGQWYEDKEEKQDVTDKIEEGLKTSQYKDLIAEYFDYSGDLEFLDVVADIVDRVDDFEDYDDIYEAIDSGLIYTEDQWEILKHYCTPQEADFDEAFEAFVDDIYGICNKVVKSQVEDEEE